MKIVEIIEEEIKNKIIIILKRYKNIAYLMIKQAKNKDEIY